MSKPNQAEFVRVKEYEKAFKKRYGKDTEIYRALTLDESGKVCRASIHVITPTQKYIMTEVLDKDGRTDFALSGTEEKEHKYKSYLEAEIYVADLIGEEDA